MARGSIYTKYRRIIEDLGLVQLDVYRVSEKKDNNIKIKDVLRLYSPAANRVILVDLDATRESLSLLEFLEKVVKQLRDNKIPVPERTLKRLTQSLKSNP